MSRNRTFDQTFPHKIPGKGPLTSSGMLNKTPLHKCLQGFTSLRCPVSIALVTVTLVDGWILKSQDHAGFRGIAYIQAKCLCPMNRSTDQSASCEADAGVAQVCARGRAEAPVRSKQPQWSILKRSA